ncbi:hemolysin XhlA family protein [Romboutsia sp. 1001216sp1]|uniref:hemolysin XhlA family protein n=1 Tax=unclassified Romboutsia TaxID=2626894 RepID=UPI00189E9A3C|nr:MULTISPECIES: hemolysin XhlA family protein [unclassified Romboutsia]MDB8790677.1 hemolysin XhlA family protein [Romboutsia sp. 1001216sp1]MDB8803240.1 hemolysin XhlA family protein [Romboutsia sp. 1001216sp1]MDB8814596.1 hemolysin XhlA family protein [Romboutsia sp. 1001216sp1]
MNEKLEQHILDNHEKRINDHSARLDKLEQNQVEFKVQIQNLVKSIEGLTSTLKWGLGFIMSGVIGFFFYAIQNHLFK